MNNKQLRNRPFLVIKNYFRPVRGTKTEKKGWAADQSNWDNVEVHSAVDRINSKTMIEASVIIDILNGTAVKNRFEEADDKIVEHFLTKYRETATRATDLWFSRKVDIASVNAFNAAVATSEETAAE